MYTKTKQMSFGDIYDECKDWLHINKPKFLELLDEYFDLSELVPLSFVTAYYRYYGRKKSYSLYSMLLALILQKILDIRETSLLINIIKLSSDIIDYCGFKSVPDQAQFTIFKQDFEEQFENLVYHLVDITEPLCQKLDANLADCLVFDTYGIEAYVTENNPKYLNTIIKRMKKYYKNNPDVDVYNMAYGSIPSSASSNKEIKQLSINGHFCYAYKFAILN